jgi:hypothetical protein
MLFLDLLNAVLGIPRSLQLADMEDLPGVIRVVRADVRNGRRNLASFSSGIFSTSVSKSFMTRSSRCTISVQCAASKSLKVSALLLGFAGFALAKKQVRSCSKKPNDC